MTSRPLPWIRLYAPRRLDDIVGQDAAVSQLRRFVREFRKGAKPLLLHGPPGTGKSTAVHALARDLDLEVVELNASDARNKASINELLGAALGQQSLFAKGKLILVDEVDGLSGTKDRGGAPALLALCKESSFPIILAANDVEHPRLKTLKKASVLVAFHPLSPDAIATILRRVADAEGVTVDDATLKAIARRADGDARAAINDLQSLSGNGTVTAEDVASLGDREQRLALEQALLRVFKTTSAEVALPAFDNVDTNIDELFLWIDENLPRLYTKPDDLARAFDALAEADKFFGRIRRWQYYRFYVYIYNLLSAGIALAKSEKYPGAPSFKRSTRPLLIWMANQRNAKRKAIAEKLAAATHTSRRNVYNDVLFLKPVFRAGKGGAIAEALELDEDEAAWLAK